MTDTASLSTPTSPSARDALRSFAHPAATAIAVVTSVALVLGRFFMTTPMWLDEALSVNIARLPLGDLAEALKHDGHPPLYYVLLHGWMSVFGDGDLAARSLSAVISVAALPLAYLAGKRIGGARLGLTTLFVVALSPYAFRFGSETRMYSLLTLEVFAGFLLVTAAIKRPKPLTLVGVAVVTAAALWTQYWAMWVIATGGLIVLWVAFSARRSNDAAALRAALMTAGAMIVGGLAFVPWLPTMLYQNQHTGTPWAPSFRITSLVVASMSDFAGGPYGEAQLGMFLLIVLFVIGIAGRGLTARTIELEATIRRDARLPLVLLIGTVVVASAVAMVNGMAFAPRYASVYFPFFALLIALGIDRFRNGTARNVLVVAVAAFSLVGVFFVVRLDRSQAGVAADAIRSKATSGVVVACPDQLGPSISRQLRNDDFEVIRYADFGDPHFVDWVDYAEKNAAIDTEAFAARVNEMAAGKPLFIVYGDTFLTLEGQCARVVELLSQLRGGSERLVGPVTEDYYEPMTVVRFNEPTA